MLSDSLTDALDHRTLTEIQRKVNKQGKRNVVSRFVHSKGDKDNITAWKQELLRVLNIFNVRLIASVGHSQTQPSPFRPKLHSIQTWWSQIPTRSSQTPAQWLGTPTRWSRIPTRWSLIPIRCSRISIKIYWRDRRVILGKTTR